VGFEPTISMFEQVKTVHAFECLVTVIKKLGYYPGIFLVGLKEPEESRSGHPVSEPRFESKTSKIRSKSGIHLITMLSHDFREVQYPLVVRLHFSGKTVT
jgi:hypothetical protein